MLSRAGLRSGVERAWALAAQGSNTTANAIASLIPPSLLLLLAAGWTILPGAPAIWTTLALRVLAGEPVARIAVTAADYPRPLFDWRALQRWGVDPSRLPAGSEIRYRDPSVWERYRWQISAIIAVMLLQATMIGGLLYEHLGRLPNVGDRADLDGASLRVESTAGRRIRKVRVTRRPVEEPTAGAA